MGALDFVRIIRPLNCAMAAFGVFIGYSIAAGAIRMPDAAVFAAMAAAFLVCAGGIAINDYFDRNIDKKLHPKKPIPGGRIKPKAALAFSLALLVIANALAALFLPLVSIAIAAGFTLLYIAYSAVLTKAKYFGNIVVAAGTSFTLVFGASLLGEYKIIAVLAASAFFANMARELIKDIEDVEADRGSKVTLPMLLGWKKVEAIVFIYYLLAMLLVYVPVVALAFGKIAFVAVVSAANFIFLLSFGETAKKNFPRAQAMAKAAMLVALFGFLAGVW